MTDIMTLILFIHIYIMQTFMHKERFNPETV